MSIAAKKRYLNPSTQLINENRIKLDSDTLPRRHRTWKEFKSSFLDKNTYIHTFKDYTIHINVRYAFKHFSQNTYNEHRQNINATIIPTLDDPLLVIKGTYENKSALTFYKPFLNNENLLHIMMYKAVIDDDGIYKFRTIYEAHSINKVSDLINALDLNTIYFKFENE